MSWSNPYNIYSDSCDPAESSLYLELFFFEIRHESQLYTVHGTQLSFALKAWKRLTKTAFRSLDRFAGEPRDIQPIR